MYRIALMAWKDLKLLGRDRMAAFFALGFPILMGVFFGLMMGGNRTGEPTRMRIATIDRDDTPISRRFVESLRENKNLLVESDTWEGARDSVRRGHRIGMMVVPQGFGKTAGVLWEDPPQLQIGLDPSRSAESAMLQGFMMESMGKLIAYRFQHPAEMEPLIDESLRQINRDVEMNPLQRQLLQGLFQSIQGVMSSVSKVQQQAAGNSNVEPVRAPAPSLQLVTFENVDVTLEPDPKSVQAQVRRLRSRWDISFPQAMLWGVMGCVASFAASIAQERTRGTLMRLQVSPANEFQLLGGKALACFLATLLVMVLLTALGMQLGMRPVSMGKLGLAAVVVAFCFVGIMMCMSTFGRSEEAVAGTGWAINLVMAMIGGCAIPVMFMPPAIARLSVLSPVHWSIRALEGAIWRDFTWREMAWPLTILLVAGLAALLTGVGRIRRQQRCL